MKHFALVLVVVGCGGSKSEQAETWKVGGLDVPTSVIPQKVAAPTVMPKKIGDELLSGELFEQKTISDKLNVEYNLGPYPNDDLVSGYQVTIYADPMADLTAKWGTPTDKEIDEYGPSKCWTAADKQLEACVPLRTGTGTWNVVINTTAPLPDRPIVPVPPEPAGTYKESPVTAGVCLVASTEELSQIVGAQLQHVDPKPEDMGCRLSRDGTSAAYPEVVVNREDPSRMSWSKRPIEGLGDKATWEDLGFVQVQVKAFVYRIRVNDPKRPVRWLRDRALQIAHKVAARAAALPQ